jgi:hypothetical protein
MKHKQLIWIVFLIFCAVAAAVFICGSFVSSAKRRPPATIKPIQISGVEYRAPNKIDSEGIVEAWDVQTDKLLWKKKIYFSFKMPLAEDQGNFMVSMTNGPASDELTIINERGGEYILNTTSKKVRTVKAGRWCWAL